MFLKYFFILLRLFGKNFKSELISLFILSVIGGFLELMGIAMIFPVILVITSKSSGEGKIIIDFISDYLPSMSSETIALLLLLVMVGIFIFKNIFMMAIVKFQNAFVKKWADFVVDDVLKKIMNAPCYETSKIPYGDKFTIIYSAIRDISLDFVLRCIILLANAIVALCIVSLLFFKFTVPALLSALFIFCFAYFENSFFKNKAKAFGEVEVELLREFSNNVNFIISSEKEIKSASKEDYFKDYVLNNSKNISDVYSKSISYGTYPLYVTEMGIILSFLIMIISLVTVENISKTEIISSLAIIVLMILRLVPQLNKVLMAMYSINKTKQKVIWFLEKYDIISNFSLEKIGPSKRLPFNSSLEFKNVSFEYDSKRGVKNVSFVINKGEFIGIIGKSGAGKTTLADLISGLNLPLSGEIFADNVLLDEEKLVRWRKNVSFLTQEPAFLADTILQNIAFGEINPDIDKAKRALNLAGINFDLNSKIDLSTGQKRRVALARAYYSNNPILILDEATSALDVQSENIVVENILKLKGQKTIIAIAHRLSTIKNCDRIFYLEEGKIKDIGTFAQLREKYNEIEDMIKISSFE